MNIKEVGERKVFVGIISSRRKVYQESGFRRLWGLIDKGFTVKQRKAEGRVLGKSTWL